MKIKLLLFCLLLMPLGLHGSTSQHRFFLEGDGVVKLKNAKTGQGGAFYYREGDAFSLKVGDKIANVFGLSNPGDEYIHPRLITLLDYLQDRLKGGTIRIVSGYRSPRYNEGLRKKGALAAKTSLHIEGMAADIEMEGISGLKLWNFVRGLNCCGAGYYHGKGIHVDVGPSRFWDEKTTGVEKDLGAHNKLILLRTNFDIYRPGESIYLDLSRITDFPIGIRPTAGLIQNGVKLRDLPITEKPDKCVLLKDRDAARNLDTVIANDFPKNVPLTIHIDFCQKPFPEMPDQAVSNPIQIQP